MKFEAVIFDLDGTLLDTIEDLADSMNRVLRDYGFPEHDVGAYKYFVGEGMENLVRRALPEDRRDQQRVAGALTAMREEYGKRWAIKTRPYEGILELLQALTGKGVKMAVLSNKPDDFTREMAAKLLPPNQFRFVLGARPGVPRKPDPAAALELVANLHTRPSRTVFLGDSNTDMRTACAAGMYPVGALWGFRTAEELIASGARKLIRKPLELLELF